MTMRIGVVGLGRIGELHARNLATSGLPSSLLLHDADEDLARRVACALDADVAPTFRDLLGGRVDGVVVATPTPSHAELVDEAIRAEIPVLCEKPLAGSVESGLALAALAAERRVPLQIGLQRRSDPELLQLRERLQGGADGRLVGLRVVSSSWHSPPAEYLKASGGFFRDKLVHDVDVIRWLTGRGIESAAVVGSGTATGWIAELGDVDSVSASLLLAGGLVAQIWAARCSPTRFEFRVDAICERQELSAGRWQEEEPSGMARTPSPFPTFIPRFAEAYAAEVTSFCRLVAGTGENACPADDAMASEVATLAVERAWREGRVVRPGEIDAVTTTA